jgi:hypothetical protein
MPGKYEDHVDVEIPNGASPEEEQQLVDDAVQRKLDDDLGDMLRDAGF